MDISRHLTSNVIVVTGHYGSGKTNLSANMALALARQGRNVTVVDLDIVNPYFRISDSAKILEESGTKMVAPVFAGTTLDTPSLGPAIDNTIRAAGSGKTIAIIDVGGDPDGATALGRYRKQIAKAGYQMIYIVNQHRFQTSSAPAAQELLLDIERVSGLRATHVVGNTHLKGETTARTVVDAIPFAQSVSELTGLPLPFITAPTDVVAEVEKMLKDADCSLPDVFPVDVYVKTPWE